MGKKHYVVLNPEPPARGASTAPLYSYHQYQYDLKNNNCSDSSFRLDNSITILIVMALTLQIYQYYSMYLKLNDFFFNLNEVLSRELNRGLASIPTYSVGKL